MSTRIMAFAVLAALSVPRLFAIAGEIGEGAGDDDDTGVTVDEGCGKNFIFRRDDPKGRWRKRS